MTRNGFSSSQKIEILSRQDHKCNKCNAQFNKIVKPHFDHKDGDSSNNDIRNGQALCAICHDNKSRRENKERSQQSKQDDPYGLGKLIGSSNKRNSDPYGLGKLIGSSNKRKKQSDDPYGLGKIGF